MAVLLKKNRLHAQRALLLELLELLDFEDFDDTFFVGVFFVVFFLVDVFLLVSVSFGSAGGVAI